ncbi:MAG: UbiA family prenyltransferase [Actinomycetota bacterium]
MIAIALGLVRATHPLPAVAVTALVGVLAAAREATGATLGWIVASTALGQASVGWSNDYLDLGRDAAAGRTEKPLVSGEAAPGAVLGAAIAALPLSVALSTPVGLPEAGVMLAGVGSAWAYNLVLKATSLSWLPYAVSFGLVPVYVWLATPSGDLPPSWIVAGGAMVGVAAHLLNVLPDLEADRAGAVRGLAHRLGVRSSLLLACGLLLGVLGLLLALGGPVDPGRAGSASLAAGIIAGVAWAGLRGRGRLGFQITIAAAGAIVLLLVLSPSVIRS